MTKLSEKIEKMISFKLYRSKISITQNFMLIPMQKIKIKSKGKGNGNCNDNANCNVNGNGNGNGTATKELLYLLAHNK